MTNSPEAIAAAREILRIHPEFSFDSRVEQAAIYIQKHCVAKDEEIENLKFRDRQWVDKWQATVTDLSCANTRALTAEQERDQLKTQLAMALDAAAKGEAGRNMGIAYEECQKENVRLAARVSELEKATCFFQSVIKSGEPWTGHCENMFQSAMEKQG